MDEHRRTVAPAEATLPEDVRRLHRILINSLLQTGDVPSTSALEAEMGVDVDVINEHLRTLQQADYLAFDTTGKLTCLYPFSTVPTPHVVAIDGERRFAMCSLDALGIAAMLARQVDIESSCPICGGTIQLVVQPGTIANSGPFSASVVAKSASDAPAVETCCGYTVFACGPTHAADLAAQRSDMTELDLRAALAAGESLFGSLLVATLAAKRTRSSISTTRKQP